MAQVLIVDDSPVVRDEVKAFLVEYQFDVITANDGLEGLEMLRKNKDIKLIISDVNMPRMDGLTMIEKIRHELHNLDVNIVMLTTETNNQMKERGRAVGIKGWIVKPFVGGKVIDKFKRLIQ